MASIIANDKISLVCDKAIFKAMDLFPGLFLFLTQNTYPSIYLYQFNWNGVVVCCICCDLYSSAVAFIHLLNSIIYSYFHEYSLIGWMLSMEYDIMNFSWLDRHRVGWIFCCRKSTMVPSIFASLEPYTYTIGAFLSGDETVNCMKKSTANKEF